MPEPHEVSTDQADVFIPSTPDLTPNLSREGSVVLSTGSSLREYPDGTPIPAKNEIGQEASEHVEDSKKVSENFERLVAVRDRLDTLIKHHDELVALSTALDQVAPVLDAEAGEAEKEALSTVSALLRRVVAGKTGDVVHGLSDEYWHGEDVQKMHKISGEYDGKAQQHFRRHEEAYKNQAVNEARHNKVEINYPGYTDQSSSETPTV